MERHTRSNDPLLLIFTSEKAWRCRESARFFRSFIWSLVLVTLLQLIALSVARAQALSPVPNSSPVTTADTIAHPTAAWIEFCTHASDECQVNVKEPEALVLTREIWQLISATNARVNAMIRPVTDQDHWGKADRWDYPDDGAGDCEDFQLLKRRLLVVAGLPRRTMRMTVVLDELGAGHAVLMMRTNRGDFILDNKTDAVLPWHKTGYEFIKREGAQGMAWVALNHHAPVITTAKP